MTTRTTPSPIEIIADADFRSAAEANAVVVGFDEGLNAVLFADAAGRALLGPLPASPAVRQIRSAARGLARTGHARVLLRQSTRAGTRVIEAELTLRPADGARLPYVLMVVAGHAATSDDADLLAAAGLLERSAVVFAGGARKNATAAFDAEALPDLAELVAGFEAGTSSLETLDRGSLTLTLARAPFGRIVALLDPRQGLEAEPASSPVADDPEPQDSSAPTEVQPGFASFSVKRSKIGEPRPGMSMGALLQRWHSRGPELDAKGEGEGEGGRQRIESTVGLPDGKETVAEASVSSPAETRRRPPVRSNWGPKAAVPAVEADPVEARDMPSTPADTTEPAQASIVEDTLPAVETETTKAAPGTDVIAATVEAEDRDATGETPLDETALVDATEQDASDTRNTPDTAASQDDAETAADERTDPVMASGTPLDDSPFPAEVPEAPPRAAFVARFDIPPVRFVWQIDRDGAFRFLSPDFAGAVGPNAADVVGRSFATVSKVFGFDETREIARLLERRDTWSGRTILWPVEGSDRKVPVDLAALPVYGRDRSFDGFRGFGIVRMNESVPDEEALGLHLTQGPAPAREEASDGIDADDEPETPTVSTPREKPFLRRFEAENFGRRAEPPVAPTAEPVPTDPDDTQKVIRLEERRRPRDGVLSMAEEAAFRAIGAKLGSKAEAESPGALRFEEPLPPAAEHQATPAESRPEPDAGGAATSADPAVSSGTSRPSLVEPDPIEPALEALSEKLARAEAEADRRLAARRNPGAAAPEPDRAPASTAPDAPEAAMPDMAGPEPAALATPERPVTTAEVVAAPQPEEAGAILPEAEADETAVEASHEPLALRSADPVAPAPDLDVVESDPAGARSPGEAAEPSEPQPILDHTADEDDEHDEPPLDIAVFERLFAGLPLAVLVQVREHTVYSNAEFASLTGHADADAVEAAGGLDALVLDRHGEGTLALMRADGEIVEVRAHMQRIAEGGRSALLMSFQSVMDEEAVAGPALEDLRQEVEELQAVLDTATDGVVLLDINGNIRTMNGSSHALFGIGADEAFGRHLSSLFAPESQRATVEYLDMLRDDGIGGILNDGREVVGRVSQGGLIPLFITIGRLSGERGWCVVIRDIAHWKRIEEDLVNARRQAEAASLHKSRFLANISHELRTPLNAIIGFADVMSSECFGPIGNERYLEYLGDIKRSGHHVLDLVNDLLDISKIEAGKIDLSFEAVSLNEVISEAVSLMQPQANRERVIVRSNLPSSVPPVVADRRTVRQIALNLLANAIRFTPAGGQIIASTTYSAEGDVLLRFRDSGIGMTEREIELALTPFQQVHAPSANRGEGTGLGLPLTKAMVEANRAYFSIQSTPGEGTLVEIIFPAPRVLAE